MSSYIQYKNRILDLIKKDVWILNGNEKSTGKAFKIFYIGNQKNKDYINKIIFDDNYNETYIGKKFFWHLYYILNKNKYKCSLAIIEGRAIEQHLFGALNDFFVPLWLESVADLPLDAKNRSSKRELVRVTKNKLEYIVTKDSEMFNDFYYNMHIPMIESRYKSGAFKASYEDLIDKIKEECYELLLIKKQNIFISGVLLNRCEKIPRLWKSGIRDFKYWNEGAIGATYIYASEYLHQKGYEKVSFGLTRGFLNDGVLHYKKKWDATFKISDERGYIFKPLIVSDGLKGFFKNNPFIYKEEEDKLYGAVFIDESEEYVEEDSMQLQKEYNIKGLLGLNIFSIGRNKKDGTFLIRKVEKKKNV